jgi:hypothetical protein
MESSTPKKYFPLFQENILGAFFQGSFSFESTMCTAGKSEGEAMQ